MSYSAVTKRMLYMNVCVNGSVRFVAITLTTWKKQNKPGYSRTPKCCTCL